MTALVHQISDQRAAGFILVLARIGPLFVIAPLFSSSLMPPRVRVVAALALTVGLAPLAMHGHQVPLDIESLGGLLLKETLVGLALSFAVAALFAAVAAAGSFLDVLTGFSYGSLVDPLNGNQGTVLSQLYSMFGLAIFIAIGGERWVVAGIARTYSLVPLTSLPRLGPLVGGAEQAFVSIFTSALEIAAPVVIALVVTDVGFGILSRVVPQLNVFAVGFPAKILVSMLVIAATLPFVSGWIENELQTSVGDALETLHLAAAQGGPGSQGPGRSTSPVERLAPIARGVTA